MTKIKLKKKYSIVIKRIFKLFKKLFRIESNRVSE